MARWVEGGEEEERGGGGGGGGTNHRWPNNVETGWREDECYFSTAESNSIDWWESFTGDSPSLLIDTQDTT